MSDRERLIPELSQAPDDLVKAVIFSSGKDNSHHPLGKFAGILSDGEAKELQESY
jgi:hypothetical protein